MIRDCSRLFAARKRKSINSLIVSLPAVLSVLLFGCGQGDTRLYNTFKSPEALIQRALQAFEEQDSAGLEALCVTRFEHDSILVPAMGKDSIDLDLAWFMLKTNIDKGIRFALSTYGGVRLELERVEFGGTETYGPIILHRSPQVTVKEPATNEEFTLGCFGTIVEENGNFKLVSIRD